MFTHTRLAGDRGRSLYSAERGRIDEIRENQIIIIMLMFESL